LPFNGTTSQSKTDQQDEGTKVTLEDNINDMKNVGFGALPSTIVLGRI